MQQLYTVSEHSLSNDDGEGSALMQSLWGAQTEATEELSLAEAGGGWRCLVDHNFCQRNSYPQRVLLGQHRLHRLADGDG
jgi:hypothetical protein